MRSFSHHLQPILQLVKMLSPAWVLLMQSQVWPFFFFALIQMKMWYSCGGDGRDRLWENLPYSVHVWLTVRTRRTKKHAAYEGRYLFTVICIWLRVCMGGMGPGRFLFFFSFFTVPFSFGRERRRIFGCRFCPPEQ